MRRECDAVARADQADRHREAQQAVRAELQQHAGEDDRAGGRRFGVRQRQPGVHREQRHLHREAGEERRAAPRSARCRR